MSCTIPGRASSLLAPLLMLSLATPVVAQGNAQRERLIVPPAPRTVYTDSLDRAVVTTLSTGDLEGAAMARTALPSLQDPEVRRFARQLLDDHEANLTATNVIAARLGFPLSSGTPVTAAAVAGTNDSQFIDATVRDHQDLLGRLPATGAMLKDEALRLHLVDTRQALLAHLEAAKKLQARLTMRNSP
jgi:predicted outer membrane protein